jgi:hypothetical protein
MHARTHACVHAYIHTHIHTCTHTYTHTHTHTHTYTVPIHKALPTSRQNSENLMSPGINSTQSRNSMPVGIECMFYTCICRDRVYLYILLYIWIECTFTYLQASSHDFVCSHALQTLRPLRVHIHYTHSHRGMFAFMIDTRSGIYEAQHACDDRVYVCVLTCTPTILFWDDDICTDIWTCIHTASFIMCLSPSPPHFSFLLSRPLPSSESAPMFLDIDLDAVIYKIRTRDPCSI